MPKSRICSIPLCGKKENGGGLCGMHWRRRRHTGTTDDPPSVILKRAKLKAIQEAALYQGQDCLIWPFKRRSNGYPGAVEWRGKAEVLAHRIVCELKHGVPEDGMHCRHLCGNGHLGCFNPNHLAWGTRLQNQQDMVEHGRSTRGERHHASKLTADDVRAIRSLAHLGSTKLGKMFGVDKSTVGQMLAGKSWSWLK